MNTEKLLKQIEDLKNQSKTIEQKVTEFAQQRETLLQQIQQLKEQHDFLRGQIFALDNLTTLKENPFPLGEG